MKKIILIIITIFSIGVLLNAVGTSITRDVNAADSSDGVISSVENTSIEDNSFSGFKATTNLDSVFIHVLNDDAGGSRGGSQTRISASNTIRIYTPESIRLVANTNEFLFASTGALQSGGNYFASDAVNVTDLDGSGLKIGANTLQLDYANTDIIDFSPGTGSSGQVLTHTGTSAEWAAPTSGSLSGLSDTNFIGLTDEDFLQYNGTGWVNVSHSVANLWNIDNNLEVSTQLIYLGSDSSIPVSGDWKIYVDTNDAIIFSKYGTSWQEMYKIN